MKTYTKAILLCALTALTGPMANAMYQRAGAARPADDLEIKMHSLMTSLNICANQISEVEARIEELKYALRTGHFPIASLGYSRISGSRAEKRTEELIREASIAGKEGEIQQELEDKQRELPGLKQQRGDLIRQLWETEQRRAAQQSAGERGFQQYQHPRGAGTIGRQHSATPSQIIRGRDISLKLPLTQPQPEAQQPPQSENFASPEDCFVYIKDQLPVSDLPSLRKVRMLFQAGKLTTKGQADLLIERIKRGERI